MAGYKSVYLCNKLLDHELGGPDYSRPATVYIRLYTTLPGIDGTGGVEVTGGSYAPLSVANNATNFPAAASGLKTNGTAFTFATATADWGVLVGAAIWDSSSGGNMLRCGPFSVPFSALNGATFQIAAGAGQFGEA